VKHRPIVVRESAKKGTIATEQAKINWKKAQSRNGKNSPRTYFAEAATKVRRHEGHEGKNK